MGGGDLNLKKSWHPSTLRNIERVWKAEQKHEVEKQKIEQLQKELAEERAREEIQAYAEEKGVVKKKDERLDWMYQGPAAMVNRDDYLMGRKIDKTLELLQHEESGKTSHNDDNLDIASSMFSSQDLTGTATVDLANKIREDPLFSIMKKEKEQRKNLLTNPVKMKQIQQLLQASLTKKNKKHKKNKKRKQSDSESDDEEINRKKSKATQKSHKERDHSSKGKMRDKHLKNSGYEEEYSYEEENYSSKKFSNGKHKETASDSKYMKSNSFYESTNHQSFKELYTGRHRHENHRDISRDSADKHRKVVHRSSYSDERNSNDDHHRNSKYRSRENNQGNNSSDYSRSSDRDNKSTSKKLSTAERERLLQEMQDNAKWRDEQRKRNTDRYREEEEREEKYQKVDTSDFLKPMLAKVAGKGSLENRVKQKIFSIQRSSSDMNKHFAKR